MPTNKTPNYQLSQWERTDRVLMDDFNADNAKIDAALKALDGKTDAKADTAALDALARTVAAHANALAGKGNCSIAAGSYSGTGSAGEDFLKTLTFSFQPKLVLVQTGGARFDPNNSKNFHTAMLVLVRGLSTFYNAAGVYTTHVSWGERSVSWYGEYDVSHMNVEGLTYFYVALG